MAKKNKFIIWCAVIAVTSFWMWASAHKWLSIPLFEPVNLANFTALVILVVFLLSLLAMGFILFRGKKEGLIMSAIVGLTYFIFFGISNINLVGVTILILLFIAIDDIVSGEIAERIKLNSRVLLRKSMHNLVVALFILISFGAYTSPAIESFKNISELPSATNVFVKKIAGQTLGNQLDQIEPGQREAILNRVTSEMIREANLFLGPYFEFAPPALAFGLFLVLWGVGWIFTWLSVFLGVLIFQVLKYIKFFNISERDVKAETIVV
jgi:hypothetical protein